MDGTRTRGTAMPWGLHTRPREQWLRELGTFNLEERASKWVLRAAFNI